MDITHTVYQFMDSHLKQIGSANDPHQIIASFILLVLGFVVIEWLVRYCRRLIISAQSRLKTPEIWQLQSLLLPLRIVSIAVLIRFVEFPLTLPKNLSMVIHGSEVLLLAVVAVYALFYGISILDRLFLQMSDDLKEAFPFQIFERLKRVLKLSILVTVGIVVIFIQPDVFPEWIFKTNWWVYFFIFAVVLIVFMVNRLMGQFFTRLTLLFKDSGKNLRLRMVLRAAIWPIRILLLVFVLFAVGEMLTFPVTFVNIRDSIIGALIAGAIFFFVYRLLDIVEFQLSQYVKRDDNLLDLNFVQVVRLITRFTVVIVGSIYVVRALSGKPLTAIFAGLGIGGIAIAMAAQDTLKNLLGGVMIMMDKPFNVGERVVVEGCDGVIEEIGFRSTRVRTLTGHLVTVPNEKMAGNRVENIAKRPHIRRLTNITITYDTPVEKIEKAIQIIRDILNNHKGMHPDFPPKVFFNEFNDTSLNIMMIYWFHPNDYWGYMEFTESVNLKIMRAFETEGIEFAFPTTTTYLAQDDRRPLHVNFSAAGEKIKPNSEKAGEDNNEQ
jgi:MscS family membrane protein